MVNRKKKEKGFGENPEVSTYARVRKAIQYHVDR